MKTNLETCELVEYQIGINCPFNGAHQIAFPPLLRQICRISCDFDLDLANIEQKVHESFQNSKDIRVRNQGKNDALDQFMVFGQIGTLVAQIENTVLIDVCPNCLKPFIKDACEEVDCAQSRGGCGYKFCNVCLEYYSRGDIHGHVRSCLKKNVPECSDPYFLGTRFGEEWKNKRSCKRIRDLFTKLNIDKSVQSNVLVNLYQKHINLRTTIVKQFPEYSKDLVGDSFIVNINAKVQAPRPQPKVQQAPRPQPKVQAPRPQPKVQAPRPQIALPDEMNLRCQSLTFKNVQCKRYITLPDIYCFAHK